MESLVIKRALISVTNKDGLLPFATFLAENGVFNTNRSTRVADGIRNEPRYS